MTYSYRPRMVCSTNIDVDLSEDGKTIESVAFTGGCDGNLRAISKLVAGKPVEEVVAILKGNTCGRKPTSCADQLCYALEEAQQALV